MSKIPLKSFEKLKQVKPEHFQALKDVLLPLLPRSRRIIESINLSFIDGYTLLDSFYVPKDEDFTNLSGIVIVVSGSIESILSFISKKEDISMALKIIEESVDWNTIDLFGVQLCLIHI